LLIWPFVTVLKSMPLGKYSRIKPLIFSTEPRCQGLWGSQKFGSSRFRVGKG
jgi:hypothetical protein